jgi:hypothetical protein
MPVWKLQTAIQVNSTAPRDAHVVTPHVNDQGVGTDPEQLCQDWAEAVSTLMQGGNQITVKAYDAQGSQPVYPQGDAQVGAGLAPAAKSPSEVALCLSFYSVRNLPRQRGRIYLPIAARYGLLSVRPETQMLDWAAEWAQALQDLGGPDVDWCVYSKTDGVPRTITNWYCDNEFDTVRSRGLRWTDRRTGTTSEA